MFGKNIKIITLAVSASLAFSTASANAETPPMPGAIPATQVITTVPGPTISTKTSSVTESQLKELVRKVEKKEKKKVVWYMEEQGLGNVKGCVSPVRKGWIKANETFSNTWDSAKGMVRFNAKWKKNDLLCGAKKIGKGKNAYIQGTIARCANRNVRIYLNMAKKKRKIVKVMEFKSSERFVMKHMKKIVNTETVTQTTDQKITYTCPLGYTPSGTWCLPPVKNGELTPPPPATAPGPNPAPSPQDPVGSNQCYSESTGLPVAPRADGLCPAGSYGA